MELYSNQRLQRELTVEDMRNLLGLWGTRLEEAGSQRTTKYHCVSGGNRSIESIDLLSRQVRDPNLWLALSVQVAVLPLPLTNFISYSVASANEMFIMSLMEENRVGR